MVRRFRWLLGGLFFLLAGCLGGYVYPTLGFIPALPADGPAGEVHAYRVDVTHHDTCFDFTRNDEYVLRPLSRAWGGHYWPQLKPGLDYGWFQLYVALNYTSHTHHTVMVRLYRRGYQTIEVRSWSSGREMKWLAASGPQEREQAIDALVQAHTSLPAMHLSSSAKDAPESLFADLAPGSALAEHRQALLFAAQEYEQLRADLLAENELLPSAGTRLAHKAQALRKLAGQ